MLLADAEPQSPPHSSANDVPAVGVSTTPVNGFAVVTLALPHRAALVADAPSALKPEQVMNRCVRGLLAWLRGGGIEPIYPGLDAITVARRTLAHLGFAETRDGPTLFQAIVAIDASFADTATLLDRLDPDGRVPMRLVAGDDCTSLAALGRAPRGNVDVDVAAMARDVATAYAATSSPCWPIRM